MDNLDIDRKLAEAMGYSKFEHDVIIRNGHDHAVLMIPDGDSWRYFRPTEEIHDAWEVFIYFKLDALYRSLNIWVAMRYGNDNLPMVNAESDESAAKAISLAAMQAIERSKSDD
ncbi:hypothetical protein NOM01_04385 [Sporolactobacillus sp. STSJ-5]|uniref:BC1872 family protein n=1 Tax=Sporolactobacillus sp. STSJ-5 TaxID=2965076 RepID=UPI0021020295|nr:hypothetical protein [Sporolactobacillus sp. STSJ-5]MCQ2009231.1 hypothetical protein [Sporolactobacillus sp. STSJ-5]